MVAIDYKNRTTEPVFFRLGSFGVQGFTVTLVRANGSRWRHQDGLINAGAIWVNEPVVVDRHFVSSRKPDDLPEFCRGILSVLGVA